MSSNRSSVPTPRKWTRSRGTIRVGPHIAVSPAARTTKAAGRVGPGGVVCGSSCYDRALGGLHPEVGETQQFERVGFPLGEEVVHFGVVVVIGHAVVRDAVR